MLYLRGRWDDAEKSANAALDIYKEQFLARWVRAQIYRDRGDMKKADAECKWFVRTYTQRDQKDDPIKDPDELALVGLAGAENARWNNLPDQFEFILNDVYKDAIKYDKMYWPAEYQAGMLLLEKYNRPEALDAFEKALKINLNAAEVIAAKGAARPGQVRDQGSRTIGRTGAEHQSEIAGGAAPAPMFTWPPVTPRPALKELGQARKVNPRDERTLGRIAACLVFQRKKDDADALTKEVEKFDPNPSPFYFEMGERLEERRYFDEAEKCFKKAAQLRPNVPEALNSLGQLYMRMGLEKEASTTLDKAFKADPFNVRVGNLRKVLRHLEKYKTLKTEHFALRYDPKTDSALAHYMASYLETIYADLAEKFNYRPKGPILIEVFNSHQMFSGRTVALPDLHTIGACTGKMIAMASPNARDINKPFNWGRVLRHEIVHIFNLEQTHFLVTHWLTEGLAVGNEGFARPPLWNQLLLERVTANKLMNLDNIEYGFIRPRNQDEWNLAYCQSQLYVEYIKSKHGAAAIGEMLAAYREGLDTGEVIQRVCKVDKATFEKGYRAFLDEAIKPLQQGKPVEKKRKLEELKTAYEKDNDLEAGAELAVRYLARDRVQARKIAEEVLERKKKQPKATYVLARLERLAGNVRQERSLLEGALNKDDPDPRLALALGKIYYDASEFDKAAEIFELGRKAEPFETSWLMQLAACTPRRTTSPSLSACSRIWCRAIRTSWSSVCGWLVCCWRTARLPRPRSMRGRRWRLMCGTRIVVRCCSRRWRRRRRTPKWTSCGKCSRTSDRFRIPKLHGSDSRPQRRTDHATTRAAEPARLGRGTSPFAETAGRQRGHLEQQFPRHGRRRSQSAQRLSCQPRRGAVFPDRRRHRPQGHRGRQTARHHHQTGRNLSATGQGAALAAAPRQHRRTRRRAAQSITGSAASTLVLPEMQRLAV